MRLFIYDNIVINVDNDEDAANILKDEKCVRELTENEITNIFGDYAIHAGPDNTEVVNGVITFDKSKLEKSVTDINHWVEIFIKPERNNRLQETDFLYRSDIEIRLTDEEKIKRDEYCQQLRDFPETITDFSDDIVWPEKPTFANVTF